MLNQALNSLKVNLSQSEEQWKAEKSQILDDQQSKFSQKESEVEKMRHVQSDLDSIKYDLDKEKSKVIELSDILDALTTQEGRKGRLSPVDD